MEPGALEAQLWEALQGEDDTTVVGTLLRLGADPNLLLSGGSAAIHLAAGMEQKRGALCLARVLQYGGDPNVRSVEGLTPLHVAASWGCSTCLRLLLVEGGDPGLEDQDGNTALDLALSHGNEVCVQILRDSLRGTEEEQNSWMSHRRAESFLSTLVSEDAPDAGEGPEGGDATPLGRTLESQRSRPGGPGSAFFFPSLASAFEGCSIAENSPEGENVRLSSSFLTEYSWRDTTLPDKPDLLPAPCGRPVVPSVGKRPPRASTEEEARPAFHWPEAHVGRNQAPSAENGTHEGWGPTSDRSSSALSRSVSPRNGASPGGPSTVRSQPPPLACTDGPDWEAAGPFPDSQEADLTLDLAQYHSFLDPGLAVKPGRRQGLDATSPDNVYLFSRTSPLTATLDFEETLVGPDFLPSQEPDAGSERLLGAEGADLSWYASCTSACYLDTSGHNQSQKSGGQNGSFVGVPAAAAGTHGVPPDSSENVGHLRSGPYTGETFPRRCPGKLRLESAGTLRPSCVSRGQELTQPPLKEEGGCVLDPLPLQEPLSPTRPPAGTPRPAGRQFVAPEPRSGGGGGTRGSPKVGPVVGEEENQVGDPDGALSLRPSEAAGSTPSCGSTVLIEASDAEGSGPDPPGGEPAGLEAQLRSMLLATKVRHSPLVRSEGGGHPVAPQATSAPQDSSGSSCLFEAPLERPRRPRRQRCPQAETPGHGKEPEGAVGRKVTAGSEMGEPDDAQFSSAGPGSSQPGSGPSDLPTGPRDPAGKGGPAVGRPRPPRVSFSRMSTPGPLCPPAPSSPVNPSIPLSPGGRPVNQSVGEAVEFLYVDEEEGYSLVERHVPCTDDSLAGTASEEEDTIIYNWRTYTGPSARPSGRGKRPPGGREAASEAGPLPDDALAHRLRDLGVQPGPATEETRKLYVDLLEKRRRRRKGDPKTRAPEDGPGYSPELSSALETSQIPGGSEDEMALAGQFDRPDQGQKWREGLLKSSFNYLLLDPRVTQNLPFRARFLSQADCFRTFLRAIFYVGKGTRSRPYSHLYEALSLYREPRKRQASPKVQHILDTWASGQGIISLHCFQNVIPVEAYTREASMVEAIGLKMLTNQKKGNYYGVVAGWPTQRRRALGAHLLHRAMKIFLAEGERQLRPADIQTG